MGTIAEVAPGLTLLAGQQVVTPGTGSTGIAVQDMGFEFGRLSRKVVGMRCALFQLLTQKSSGFTAVLPGRVLQLPVQFARMSLGDRGLA